MQRIGLLILSLLLIALSIRQVPTSATTIVLEAENYANIVEPMKVTKGAEVSGDAFIELPLGVGQGWQGKGGGEITYRMDFPESATYTLWARTLWKDGCTNAFFLDINDDERMVFGNDAIFEQWHWIKGQSFKLDKGINYLTFANHSDGTAMDKIILTNDLFYFPEGLGQDITQFFDGFAGCDANNTGSWDFVSGKWRVVKGGEGGAAGVNDCLAQWAPGGGRTMAGFPVWTNYDFKVKTMLTDYGSVALSIYSQSPENEYRITFNVTELSPTLTIAHVDDGEISILAETPISTFNLDHWYEIGYIQEEKYIVILLDGQKVLRVELDGAHQGRVGLLTQDTGGVYFDNVNVQFH
jgi:hypothetical protein